MSYNSLDSSYNVASEMTRKLGFNPQATYMPVIRDTFYQLVPANFKFYYYNAIRRALYWYQGFVPEVHNPSVGIMSTAVGNSIVKELTKLIIGGRVFYQNKYKEKENNKGLNSTLKAFEKYSDEYKFQNLIKQAFEYTVAGGTSALLSYVNDRGDLHYLPYRIDQFFYDTNLNGDISRFTGFLSSYTAKVKSGSGRAVNEDNFYLVEERYYNDNLKPIKRYTMKRASSNVTTGQSFDISSCVDMKWEQLPKEIQKQIKKEFSDMVIGVEIPIKYTDNLGVYLLRFTVTNRVPEIHMGESALLNVFKYLVDYEYAESALDTDMYLGRGKIYLPTPTRNPTDNTYETYYSGYDSLTFESMPMKSYKEQKPMSVQFDLRAKEWVDIRNNTAEKISSALGVGGSDVFSYLRDSAGSSKTATQIADETRKTLSFVEEKREIFISDLDLLFKDWIKFNGYDDEITIKFSSQNLVNKLVTIDELRVFKELGLSSFDLFKQRFPDKDDDQIQEMVDRKFEEMERIQDINTQSQMRAFESRLTNGTRATKINGRKEGKGIEETEETQEKTQVKQVG